MLLRFIFSPFICITHNIQMYEADTTALQRLFNVLWRYLARLQLQNCIRLLNSCIFVL